MATMEAREFRAFPYGKPYAIQQLFMSHLYETLDNKQIGLFESPTGTGKTLSVICSSLQWLSDHRQSEAAKAQEAPGGDEENEGLPDWMQAAPPAPATTQPSQAARKVKKSKAKKQQDGPKQPIYDEDGQDITEFLINDPSEAAAGGPRGKRPPDSTTTSYLSSSSSSGDDLEGTQAAAAPWQHQQQQQAALQTSPQLIFCSRTHSQLSQFVHELHRTCFADELTLVAVGSRKNLCINEQVRQLQSLTSINERCQELQRNKHSSGGKTAALNPASHTKGAAEDGLGSLANPKPRKGRVKSRDQGCPFLRLEGGEAGWERFKDAVLASPLDVEELARMGRSKQVCPYYGSRRAVPEADIVLAPYSCVLQPEARDSLGIQLKDAVVIFDEAHNLLDAINSAHSAAVTCSQLLCVHAAVSTYYQRFKALLSPSNALQVQLIMRIASALYSSISAPENKGQQQQQGPSAPSPSPCSGAVAAAAARGGGALSVNDLLFDLGLDNINMFQLIRWMKEHKMVFKLAGYAGGKGRAAGELQLNTPAPKTATTAATAAAAPSPSPSSGVGNTLLGSAPSSSSSAADDTRTAVGYATSCLQSFVSFLVALTNTNADGRIILEPAGRQGSRAGGASRHASTSSHHVAALAAASSSNGADGAAAAGGDGGATGSGGSYSSGRLQFILLNAACHFGTLLSQARSVVLVSGTLAPISSLTAQLFPDLPANRLVHFECGHVIPPEQLLAVSIGRGPLGRALDCRHEARGREEVMDELGQLLFNLAGVVPEGMVVFVASFQYMEQLMGRWEETGMRARMETRKAVFREPRSAQEVEEVLEQYAAAIAPPKQAPATAATPPADAGVAAAAAATATAYTSPADAGIAAVAAAETAATSPAGVKPGAAAGASSRAPASKEGTEGAASTVLASATAGVGGSPPAAAGRRPGGAMLLCVVGGKLSEGINFGDALGRCVVVIGMPFPNPSDPELKERMQYLDRQALAIKMTAPAAAGAGKKGSAVDTAVEASKEGMASAVGQGASAAPSVLPAALGADGGAGRSHCRQSVGGTSLDGGEKATALLLRSRQTSRPSHPFQPATAAADGGGGGLQGRQQAAFETEAASAQPSADAAASADDAMPTPSTTTTAAANTEAAAHGPGATGLSPAAAGSLGTLSGRHYYADLCFKAVNQCVGRVVRHKGDYAVVVLADSRWVVQQQHMVAGTKEAAPLAGQAGGAATGSAMTVSTAAGVGVAAAAGQKLPGVVGKLPGWIQRSYVGGTGDFGEAFKRVAVFFRGRASAGSPGVSAT